jgi:DNA-binding transcriptional ArsR family regulator
VLPISTTTSDDVLELNDPKAMRALAHPVRLAILDVLDAQETTNATECARRVGESPQACSYHLRALAKWGIVRTVESADGRETRWQLSARNIRFGSGAKGSPGYDAATAALQTTVLARDERIIGDFFARQSELPEEWRHATFSSALLHLTQEELVELTRRIEEITREYDRPREGDRPDGARQVDVVFRAIPKVGD